jgi:hypothetical protein
MDGIDGGIDSMWKFIIGFVVVVAQSMLRVLGFRV